MVFIELKKDNELECINSRYIIYITNNVIVCRNSDDTYYTYSRKEYKIVNPLDIKSNSNLIDISDNENELLYVNRNDIIKYTHDIENDKYDIIFYNFMGNLGISKHSFDILDLSLKPLNQRKIKRIRKFLNKS